jgi:hypothetical protein
MLHDYCNERENVVVFVAGVGCPAGNHHIAGYPDLDFLDRTGIYALEGTVDAEGDWRWNGEGNPRDDSGNAITKIHAYVDASRWAREVGEYENAM